MFKLQALCIRYYLIAGLIIFLNHSLQIQLLLRIYKVITFCHCLKLDKAWIERNNISQAAQKGNARSRVHRTYIFLTECNKNMLKFSKDKCVITRYEIGLNTRLWKWKKWEQETSTWASGADQSDHMPPRPWVGRENYIFNKITYPCWTTPGVCVTMGRNV